MSETSRIHTFSHQSLGTTFWVRLVEEDYAFAERAAESAFYLLDELDRELHQGAESGQIKLINAMPSGEVMAVSQTFANLWNQSEVFRKESDGAFDVRAGRLLKYWEGHSPSSFSPDDTDWAEAFNNYKYSEYRLDGLELHAVKNGAAIDFSAIIKGYAVDRMAETLESTWGIHRALVIAGSNVVRALDPPGEAAGWRLTVGSVEQLLCRSALASRTRVKNSLPIVDARTGEAFHREGVVRALASSACEAQYLSLMGAVLSPTELAGLIGESGQRGLWLMNDKRLGAFSEAT